MSAPRSAVILVVEDDDLLRLMLQLALTRAGYIVLEARDGQEAVATSQREKDAIAFYCLDVELPLLDGPSIVLALRASGLTPRFCFMTAGTTRYNKVDLLAFGADEVFDKPFSVHALLAAARRGCPLPDAFASGG